MIGQTISHYKILEKLGEGGMGVVYKAEDVTLDRTVALKFLPTRTVVTDNDRARFSNEARAAAKLTHPNIATVYEFGEADGEKFLAMEFVEGETLSNKLRRGPLSVSDVLRIVSEVASGLGAAHQRGIIHRDIKSENIMLTPQGAAKITDFGLAQIRGQSRLWHTEGTAGTVSYMLPEQARGEALDERTDIWSLGVVLYEMLTAKLPFPGSYESAILYLVLHEQPQPMKSIREDVPTKLHEVVEKCLKKDPGQRYQNGEALLSDVKALVKELEQGVQEPQEKPVEQRRFETERRPVTIMFATILAGGHESEEPDPEALSTGLDECFDGLTSIIQKYDGMKDRILGDRLMAVFGAPAAHENDPERAVRCAQEMMSHMKRINALGISQVSTALQLKIGIHSGVVVAGNVGTEKGAGYSVVGDVINITAGITDFVQPGEIHLSADTLKLVPEIVEVGEARSVPLKGKTQEIIVYKLRSLKAGIEPGRRAVGTGAFVGRADEIRLFEESLEHVQKKGEVRVFIRGEAGVGKTRLKSELTNRAQKRRMSICEGKCSSFETNTPYYLWNTLLRSLLRVDQETSESEVRSRLHEMVKILTIESDEPYLAALLSLRYEEILLEEDEPRKRKIFDAARRLLKTYAERKPSVFLFEDLHWIDRFSQSLLEFVLSEKQLGPALIVCFYRPEYAGAKRITESGKELDLNRLPGGEARELMRLRLGAESMPENLAILIEQRSEGNPFFIEEIIKTLMDKGIVIVKKGKLEIQSEKLESGIPETLQGVILARIDRLEERIREVLLDASVIGREFSTPVLEHIVGNKIDVKGGLKKLESLELVFEKEDARELEYLFKHYLIQEVAYNTLLQKKRKQIHVLIAQAIEKLYAERINEFYELLAFHYEKAEDWEKAATYLSRAGRKAEEIFSKQESEGFYERKTEAVKQLYSTSGADRPILKFILKVFTILVAVPIGISIIAATVIWCYISISKSFTQPLGWVLTIPFDLIFIWSSTFMAFVIAYGFINISFKKGARLYDILEDHLFITLSDGSNLQIPYSEIIAHQFRSFFGIRMPLLKYLSGFLKRLKGNYSFALYSALPWKVYFGGQMKNTVAPTILGLSPKEGTIVIQKKTGHTVRKKLLYPWLMFSPSKSKEIGLTPANPTEFYKQFSLAYEKWRRKILPPSRLLEQSTMTERILNISPKYKLLNLVASIVLPLLFYFAIGVGNMLIASSKMPLGGRIITLFLSIVLLSATAFMLISLLSYRKYYDATRYDFHSDRMAYTMGFGGIQSGEIRYRDINEINLVQGLPKSLFGLGVIEIVSAKPIEFLPGVDKKPALYLFDIPDAEENYRKIRTIVFGEQQERQ